MPIFKPEKMDVYKERRAELVKRTVNQFQKDGNIVLFANFEQDGTAFKQDASFYYYTGIVEPATVLIIDTKSGDETLLVPNTNGQRAKWVAGSIEPTSEAAAKYGVDTVEYLGKPCAGYQCHPFFTQDEYGSLLEKMNAWVKQGKTLYSINPQFSYSYVEQRFILGRIASLIPDLKNQLQNISMIIADMRRTKSKAEIEQLFNAIKITEDAQVGAAQSIKPGVVEYEVQAAIEYIFTTSGASTAFPSIVASGKNSTVLHYSENNKVIDIKELVVVDIGAEYNYYCADITRTFPSSGKFSKRQKEIYNMVLEAQDYVAGLAKPGMWLSNKEQPEQSLHHLAMKFFERKGFGQYFPHGIGHFLGLDVHDVGDYKKPLEIGDVITIEPGIYIPEENLGVRIEDDYWIIENGSICLSEDIPKAHDEIEKLVQEKPAAKEADA